MCAFSPRLVASAIAPPARHTKSAAWALITRVVIVFSQAPYHAAHVLSGCLRGSRRVFGGDRLDDRQVLGEALLGSAWLEAQPEPVLDQLRVEPLQQVAGGVLAGNVDDRLMQRAVEFRVPQRLGVTDRLFQLLC